MPSAVNGVVGIKPTWGRVSRRGVLALAPSLDHVGPMARRVADAAAVLDAIAGRDPDDPTSLPDQAPGCLGQITAGIRGVRIGVDEAYAYERLPAYNAAAVAAAIQELERLGARIVSCKLPECGDAHSECWLTLSYAEAAAVHAQTFPSRADRYGPGFRTVLEIGNRIRGVEYADANALRLDFRGRWRNACAPFDLVASPSAFSDAYPYTAEDAYGKPDAAGKVSSLPPFWRYGWRFALPHNFTGAPTISVPCGFSPDGLPLGLQLAGHPLSEALLCRAGHAYESATEWRSRHPEG